MIHSVTGLIHTLAASLALIVGLFIFASPKATMFHRTLGFLYSLAMLVLLGTAFFIYHLTRSFNLLHVFAIVASLPLAAGLFAVVTRTPARRWVTVHYYWMCWSYIGLVSAFLAEMSTRLLMPFLVAHGFRSMGIFWTLVGLATGLVTYGGALLVKRNVGLVDAFQRTSAASEPAP